MSVSARLARKLLADRAKNPNLQLLDVRTITERNVSYIPDSSHIPLDQIEKQVQKLSKSDTYLVYCRSGRRSLQAIKILQKNGINAINLEGGILQWQKVSSEQNNKAQSQNPQPKKNEEEKSQSSFCNLI